jgi:hypothetical protein
MVAPFSPLSCPDAPKRSEQIRMSIMEDRLPLLVAAGNLARKEVTETLIVDLLPGFQCTVVLGLHLLR